MTANTFETPCLEPAEGAQQMQISSEDDVAYPLTDEEALSGAACFYQYITPADLPAAALFLSGWPQKYEALGWSAMIQKDSSVINAPEFIKYAYRCSPLFQHETPERHEFERLAKLLRIRIGLEP